MVEGESPTQASTPAGAVFLSYASQDAEAAKRICEALRAAGIEVWFDQSELRGGDAWDRSIRQQIHDCALFAPIISQHTHERLEGYFRLEWKLAVDRTHTMAEIKAFLVPIVIDSTTERDPAIPEKFRELQWTRLPAGETPPAFVARVQRLLSGETSTTTRAGAVSGAVPTLGGRAPASGWSRRVLPAAAVVLVLGAVAYLAIERPWISKPVVSAAFAPPPHSIAVLPFVNMSGDKEQEYFSDGLSEELIDLLTRVPDLQVPARTSSFFFKGKPTPITAIAKELNVANVLEGSVRKAGNALRITAELVRADTGYHVWSQTYDAKLDDVFKIQDEIAAAVVSALEVSLLARQAPHASSTTSSEAYSLYLQGEAIAHRGSSSDELRVAVSYLQRSVSLDPRFAPAWAQIANMLVVRYAVFSSGTVREINAEARAAAERALKLDPTLPLAHMAMGRLLSQLEWDWDGGERELKQALVLDPGSPETHRLLSYLLVTLGRFDEAVNQAKAAIPLDPLMHWNYFALGFASYRSARFIEADGAFRKAIELSPTTTKFHYLLGLTLLAQGRPTAAEAEMELELDPLYRQVGTVLAFDAMARRSEADRLLAEVEHTYSDRAPYLLGLIYAARKDADRAFEWLNRAVAQHNGDVVWMQGDPLLGGLRGDTRYALLLRKMNLSP